VIITNEAVSDTYLDRQRFNWLLPSLGKFTWKEPVS